MGANHLIRALVFPYRILDLFSPLLSFSLEERRGEQSRVLRKAGRNSRIMDRDLGSRAFYESFSFIYGLQATYLFYILYCAGPPVSSNTPICFVCSGPYTFELMLCSVARTIMHLDGIPILSLHSSCVDWTSKSRPAQYWAEFIIRSPHITISHCLVCGSTNIRDMRSPVAST
jgi:hypothetical protein